jgi:hypothetical protein
MAVPTSLVTIKSKLSCLLGRCSPDANSRTHSFPSIALKSFAVVREEFNNTYPGNDVTYNGVTIF